MGRGAASGTHGCAPLPATLRMAQARRLPAAAAKDRCCTTACCIALITKVCGRPCGWGASVRCGAGIATAGDRRAVAARRRSTSSWAQPAGQAMTAQEVGWRSRRQHAHARSSSAFRSPCSDHGVRQLSTMGNLCSSEPAAPVRAPSLSCCLGAPCSLQCRGAAVGTRCPARHAFRNGSQPCSLCRPPAAVRRLAAPSSLPSLKARKSRSSFLPPMRRRPRHPAASSRWAASPTPAAPPSST